MDYKMMGGLAKGVSSESKMGSDAIAEIVGTLFMSRTYAHMAHLKTAGFAKHKALNEFYDDVIDLVDKLAESAQGQYGKLDIPFVQMKGDVNDPIGALTMHMTTINDLGEGCDEEYIESILQEVEVLFRQTLYKLKELS